MSSLPTAAITSRSNKASPRYLDFWPPGKPTRFARLSAKDEPLPSQSRAGGVDQALHAHDGPPGGRRLAFSVQTMARIDCLQQWFNLSATSMEEALCDTVLLREFVGIEIGQEVIRIEAHQPRIRHLLKAHDLRRAILQRINALLQVQCPIPQEGTVVATAASVADVTQAQHLLHSAQHHVWVDADNQCAEKRAKTLTLKVRWYVAMRPGGHRMLDKTTLLVQVQDAIEGTKAYIRAKGEHLFCVITCFFGFTKCSYRGLPKIAAKFTLCAAPANLFMVQHKRRCTQDECTRSSPKWQLRGAEEALRGPQRPRIRSNRVRCCVM